MSYLFAYNSSNACIYDIINISKVPKHKAFSTVLIIHGLIFMLISPIMGAFLDTGINIAYILAAVCILFFTVLYLYTLIINKNILKKINGGHNE